VAELQEPFNNSLVRSHKPAPQRQAKPSQSTSVDKDKDKDSQAFRALNQPCQSM
jgi:hypothetical protein